MVVDEASPEDLKEVDRGDQCPVCGWAVIRSESVPENPDGSTPFGMLFVHELRSQGRAGHFHVDGCTLYSDGRTEVWEPGRSEKPEASA